MSTSSTFIPVANSTSDGYWDSYGAFYGGQGIFLGKSGPYSMHSYVLFAQTIPKNSIIISAHASIPASASESSTTVNTTVYFNNVGSPVLPTSAAEGEALAKTSGTAWDNLSGWTGGTRYETSDITSDLQTIISRADYVTGNNILLLIKDNGSTASAHRHGVGYHPNSGQTELHVVYEPSITVNVPLDDTAFTAQTPSLTQTAHSPLVSTAFTTHIPSRNYYNMDTTGLMFYPLNPVIGTNLLEVLKRFNLNAIGERISLKFDNAEAFSIILNDCGIAITELYRRDSAKMNVKGNHLSFKFQNNTASTSFELQYMKMIGETYENQ